MLGVLTSIRASGVALRSRRDMLDTLLKHLDMIRLSIGLIAILAVAGCNGLIREKGGGGGGSGSGSGSNTPEQQAALDAWTMEAHPALTNSTCFACHAGTNPSAPAFLAGSADLDIRNTLLGFNPQIVDLNAPQSSRLVTKGAHEGPAITNTTDLSNLVDWMTKEATAAMDSLQGSGTLIAGPFNVQLCTAGSAGAATCPINTVMLDPLIAGATISFVAQPLTNAIYLDNLTLVAGSAGAFINHPLFVSVDGSGNLNPDTIDRFFNVELDVAANGSAMIGGGAGGFEGFSPANQMEIAFQQVSTYQASGSGSGSGTASLGCKAVTQFAADAIPVMGKAIAAETNFCANCHGGQNGTATTNMNLTKVNDGVTADQQTVCNNVLPLVTFTNGSAAATSPLLLAPDPGQDAAHPFKLSAADFTTFANGIKAWASAENQ
jgi:hypothetical protein